MMLRASCLRCFGAWVSAAVILAGAGAASAQTAFRGFWVDAFNPGFKSTAQIDTMVARAKQGNYNAIVAEGSRKGQRLERARGVLELGDPAKATDIRAHRPAGMCTKAQPRHSSSRVGRGVCVSTAWPPAKNATLAGFRVVHGHAGRHGHRSAATRRASTFSIGFAAVQSIWSARARNRDQLSLDGINWD